MRIDTALSYVRAVLTTLRTTISKATTPLLLYLGNRLVLFVFVFLGLAIDQRVSHPWRAFPENFFLDGWFRWDSGWYLRVSRTGYDFAPTEIAKPMGYFPLYPMLIRFGNAIVGDPFIPGFVISNVSLLVATVLLHRLLVRNYGERVATRSIVLMLCYPFAYYYSAMYTESLFLMGAVGAFYFSRKNCWLLASLFAAIAGATRLVGMVVMLPVAMTYMARRSWRISAIGRDGWKLGVGLIGIGGYMFYLYLRFDDPIIFMRTQWVPGWGDNFTMVNFVRTFTDAMELKRFLSGQFNSLAVVNVVLGIGALLLCLIGSRRLGFTTTLWAVLTLLISLRIWGSAGRYACVVWPMYVVIALATVRREVLYQTVVTGFCLIQALYAFWFSHGQYVN